MSLRFFSTSERKEAESAGGLGDVGKGEAARLPHLPKRGADGTE